MEHLDPITANVGGYHEANNGHVRITEYTFDNPAINDAHIRMTDTAYPSAGEFAVNQVSTALISVEEGKGTLTIKGQEPVQMLAGDRYLIEPGEAYRIATIGDLVLRYLATPAFTPEQSLRIR